MSSSENPEPSKKVFFTSLILNLLFPPIGFLLLRSFKWFLIWAFLETAIYASRFAVKYIVYDSDIAFLYPQFIIFITLVYLISDIYLTYKLWKSLGDRPTLFSNFKPTYRIPLLMVCYLGSLAPKIIVTYFEESVLTNSVQKSESLEPSISPGDYIFVKRSGFQVERGDMITFISPSYFHFQEEPKEMAKRVLGLPGDKIRFKYQLSSDKTHTILRTIINGKEIPLVRSAEILDQRSHDTVLKNKYLYSEILGSKQHSVLFSSEPAKGTPEYFSESGFTLHDDEYFVIGDNRDSSYDSRFTGPIKSEEITGKVERVYFSINWKNYTCQEIMNSSGTCPMDWPSRLFRANIRWENFGKPHYLPL